MRVIDSVRDAIGENAATRFVEEFGGRKIYVPIKAAETHAISQIIGMKASTALSRRFGGEYIQVASPGVRRRRIVMLLETGMKPSEVARRLGCSRQWVSRVQNSNDDALINRPH